MPNQNEPIVVERIFNCEALRVWRAITDPREMREWYFENILAFEPIVGFETSFEVRSGDKIFPHLWTVKEVVPLKKISTFWRFAGYCGVGLVTFAVVQERTGTKLTLTSEVLESFPDNIPEFTRSSGFQGWNYLINNRLRSFLE